jgi:hypothetical protein
LTPAVPGQEPIQVSGIADLLTTYEEGKDYRLGPDGRYLVLPSGSGIPSKTVAELYPAAGASQSIRERRDGSSNLLFGEGHFFHDMQTCVTYTHDDAWAGETPVFQRENLARSIALLKERRALAISVSGDSISAGGNASLFVEAPPRQPAYPQLVAMGLERAYGAKVTVKNRAVGGWKANQGAADAAALAADKPDLVEAHLTWSRLLGLYAAWSASVPKRFGFEHGDLLICWLLSFDAEVAHGSIELFFGKILNLRASVLLDLLHLERQGRQRDLVEQRRRLRDLQPALFRAYMATR